MGSTTTTMFFCFVRLSPSMHGMYTMMCLFVGAGGGGGGVRFILALRDNLRSF